MFSRLLRRSALVLTLLISGAAAAVTGSSDYNTAPLTPSRFITYQGLQIAVYESAGTRGPGILMVHGNTSSANAYEKVFNSRYAQRHKIVLMDMPGYGRSDNAPQYNVAQLIGAIQAVALATNTDTGVLVGWSLGAFYGVQATQLLPQLKGLFLFGDAVTNFDPSLPSPFLTPAQSYAGAAVNYGTVQNLTSLQVVDYVNYFFGPNYGRIPRPMIEDGLRADPATRGAILNIVLGTDPIAEPIAILSNATFKLALVNGAQDAFVNNDRYAAIEPLFPTLFRNRTIFIQNAGHAPQIENTSRFLDILGDFVQSL